MESEGRNPEPIPASSEGVEPFYRALAEAIGCLGADAFWGRLAAALCEVVPRCVPTIFVFERELPATMLHPDSSGAKEDLQRYLRSGYLLDPWFTLFVEGAEPRLYTLREITPEDFAQSEYFSEYFRFSNIADEAGYLIDLPPGVGSTAVHVALSLEWSHRPFTDSELFQLRALRPVVEALVRRHFDIAPMRAGTGAGAGNAHGSLLERAFANLERPLTSRERAIVRLILRGHSSRSAAARLDVSVETVRNHRKSIHRKLEVSSAAELFSRFLDSLDRLAGGGAA